MIAPRSLEERFREIDRQLRDLRSASMPFSSDSKDVWLRNGNFILEDDGAIEIRAEDGKLLADFDKAAVTFYDTAEDPLVVLDRNGVAVGDAPVLLNATGVDIASGKVKLNASGLEVDGGNVQAVWLETGDDTAENVSLNTTYQEVAALTFDPPNWVQTLFVMATSTGQITNNSGSAFNGLMRMTLDDGGGSSEGAEGSETAPNGTTAHFAITEVLTVPLSPAGRAVDVTLDARVNAGSTAVNLFGLKVLVFGVRDAFV